MKKILIGLCFIVACKSKNQTSSTDNKSQIFYEHSIGEKKYSEIIQISYIAQPNDVLQVFSDERVVQRIFQDKNPELFYFKFDKPLQNLSIKLNNKTVDLELKDIENYKYITLKNNRNKMQVFVYNSNHFNPMETSNFIEK